MLFELTSKAMKKAKATGHARRTFVATLALGRR